MGFQYLDGLATPENIETLISLFDKVAGARYDSQNIFDIEDLLANSPQMQKCFRLSRAARVLHGCLKSATWVLS